MSVARTAAIPTRPAAGPAKSRLDASQMVRLVVLGVVLWFVFAHLIHFLAAAELFGGDGLLFAVALPVTFGFIPLARRAAALRPDQIVSGVALASMAAMLCDGIALTWVRGLYGSDPTDVLGGAAWLFWCLALGLLWAFLLERRSV